MKSSTRNSFGTVSTNQRWLSFCVDQSGAVSSLARMIRIDNSKQAQWSVGPGEGGGVQSGGRLPLAPGSLVTRSTGTGHLSQPGNVGTLATIETISSDGTTAALFWELWKQNPPDWLSLHYNRSCCCCCCCCGCSELNCDLVIFLILTSNIVSWARVGSAVRWLWWRDGQHRLGPGIIRFSSEQSEDLISYTNNGGD